MDLRQCPSAQGLTEFDGGTGPARCDNGDLDDPGKVAEMVRRFYADVAQDTLLGPVFNDVARVDWSTHLPRLTAFWCRALFSMPGYEGNPYRAHQTVNAEAPFTVELFERWLELFTDIVDSGWVGPKADQAKALGRKVAEVHCRQIVGRPLAAEDPGPDHLPIGAASTDASSIR